MLYVKKTCIDFAAARPNRWLDSLFLFFCMFPFLFPNPVLVTDMQPYAALFATLICLLRLKRITNDQKNCINVLVFFGTFYISLIVFLFGDIGTSAMRGLFNYFSVFVIPTAAILVLHRYEEFPEKFIKACILAWFLVSTVQFFVRPTFLLRFVSGARYGVSGRGICGLAAEPSFMGIACFYFLHLIKRMKTQRGLYIAMTIIMATLYAQSAMGILFILVYWIVYLLENVSSRKGLYVWFFSIGFLVVGGYVFSRYMQETRLYALVSQFMDEGVFSMTDDESIYVRLKSITQAFAEISDHYWLPQGFQQRIGSGYGGFLCELGFLAIPALFVISAAMAKTFRKTACRVLYFILVSILLCNNTQIGNPLLLLTVGVNLYFDTVPDRPKDDTVRRNEIAEQYEEAPHR